MTTFHALGCRVSRLDAHTVRLSLDGSLTHDTADEVLRRVTAHLATHPGTRAVHLDCAGVAFCDSHGLSVLLMAHRAVDGSGRHLQLEDVPPPLLRILEITGTLGYLTSAPQHAGGGENEERTHGSHDGGQGSP